MPSSQHGVFVFCVSSFEKSKNGSQILFIFFWKKIALNSKKKILSNFRFGGIRFIDSRKETRTSGILAFF